MKVRGERVAPGAPGIEARWEHGDKVGVGTAYSSDSRLWYTLWRGVVTEVYYPFVDHPQLRDLQFLISDGQQFFHEERHHLVPSVRNLDPVAPGYAVSTQDPQGRYVIEKEVIAAPHRPVLLERVILRRAPGFRTPLKLYALAAPHLGIGGALNNGYVIEIAGQPLLAAERDGNWLVLGASVPWGRLSAGYVGTSDGWTDLNANLRMDWEYDRAPSGNVALTGELAYVEGEPFTLALAFGSSLTNAATALLQTLAFPYERHRERFLEQWRRAAGVRPGLAERSGDHGHLLRTSVTTLLCHEDKSYPGAFIASLAIPWGNSRNDSDRGGYHLVWTRDLCQVATGLLAVDHAEAALRTLLYLAASQRPDGSFPQNFWLNGDPYWAGIQLDEVSFPVLLAGRLREAGALAGFDPYPMVRSAARFLVEFGPATGQERWEEVGGYSPSTLAAHIAALCVAASFARERSEPRLATFLEGYADFLESHLEAWTVTRNGTELPGRPHHFVRILPADPEDPTPTEDPETTWVSLANQPPGAPNQFPARAVVDPGFLELVRYGVRRADDPLLQASVEVVDHALKVDTPAGPVWRRYSHDGYGQRDDGGPFDLWGTGRAWPLLAGERGHFELARGGDPTPYLRTLERIASTTGLLPEQVWDQGDLPEKHLALGRPTGAAMPLAWAHAEYLKLLRSTADRHVFDRVRVVEERYGGRPRSARPVREVWKHRRQPGSIRAGTPLRIQCAAPFRLHYSLDGWRTVSDLEAVDTGIGISVADPEIPAGSDGPLLFTFYWPERGAWEGRDYRVELRPAPDGA